MKRHFLETEPFFFESVYKGIHYTVEPIEDDGFLRFVAYFYEDKIMSDGHLIGCHTEFSSVIKICKNIIDNDEIWDSE